MNLIFQSYELVFVVSVSVSVSHEKLSVSLYLSPKTYIRVCTYLTKSGEDGIAHVDDPWSRIGKVWHTDEMLELPLGDAARRSGKRQI